MGGHKPMRSPLSHVTTQPVVEKPELQLQSLFISSIHSYDAYYKTHYILFLLTMAYRTRGLVLTTLVVICANCVLASHHNPRFLSSHRHQSFLKDNQDYLGVEAKLTSQYNTFQWPSNTEDCLRFGDRFTPDAPAWYLRDGQIYDRHCLKTLMYLVEPEERAVCRTQSGCHDARGYDNDCLVQLSFDQGFSFDLEETKRQELEWKRFVCRGKTLDQCGYDHSLWWRSLFPSSRDDCRIRGRFGKGREDVSSDNWVPWSIGPNGTAYDTDCLSRFANRLRMENPGNCTQANNYVIQKSRDVPPAEIPKTLLHASNPSGIQPDLEFPTGLTDPGRLTATPVTTHLSEDPIKEITPEPHATDISDLRKKRNRIPPSPIRTLAETVNGPVPTLLPPVNRAQGSAPDEWSCLWDVNVTLPDFAPRMFDVAFGNTTVYEIPLGSQRIMKGELEKFSEGGGALGEEIIKSSPID
jgi:hypothetical protein